MTAAKKVTPTVTNADPMMPSREATSVIVGGVMAPTRVMVEFYERIEVIGLLVLTAAAAPQYLYDDKKRYYHKRRLEKVSHNDASIRHQNSLRSHIVRPKGR